MSDTTARLHQLIDEHLDLGREPDAEVPFTESGVSSVNTVAFMKVVEKEFGISIVPEALVGMTLNGLVAHIEANSG